MARFLLMVVMAVLFLASPYPAAQATEIIRVGLGSSLAKAEVQITGGSYDVVDLANGAVLGEAVRSSCWAVAPVAGQRVCAVERSGASFTTGQVLFRHKPGKGEVPVFALNGRRYRGDLRLEPGRSGGLTAVNLLDVEEYLYGVVGEELGYRAPVEALKAQAVACRTYALSRRASQAAAPFDVGTDQGTQVYSGFEAESKPGFAQVKAAVDTTRGQVLLYQGRLIEAYFHSNSGGHTENSENVWQQALPYLRGVPSPWDEYALHYQPQSPGGWPAYSYQWDRTLTRADLEQSIAAWNLAHAGQPWQVLNVGEVLELTASRIGSGGYPTISGRITSLVLRGRDGSKKLSAETARSLLGLRSTLFELRPDSQVFVLGAGGEPEERQTAESLVALAGDRGVRLVNEGSSDYWVAGADHARRLPKIFSVVSIHGHGYGHGLGMSQWGAWGMAMEGYGYRDILEYYYNQGKKDGLLKIASY